MPLNTFIETVKQKTLVRALPLSLLVSAFWLTPHAQAGWELEWIDNFDGDGVNWDYWYPQVQANYNNEEQCYTDDDSSDDRNFDVSDGTLKIIARRGDIECPGLNGEHRGWTSGRINSKDRREFLYGRLEARLRFDTILNGSWPAFWLLEGRINQAPIAGDNDFAAWPNPGAGEIDVWEWIARRPSGYITNFFPQTCGKKERHDYPGDADDAHSFQRYAIEWTPDHVSFYMNDRQLSVHDMSDCPQFEEPLFVLLNVAIGGDLGGEVDPALNMATMEVDYVAYCSLSEDNNAKACGPNTPLADDTDKDGISNFYDRCGSTPSNTPVDIHGCAEKSAPAVAVPPQAAN